MKKIVFSLVLTTILGFANTAITGFSSPESIIVSKDNVYVSNVGKKLKPSTKDGDGFISKLDKNGKVKELKFIGELNAPKGMEIIDNILFIADIDTLRGFDLNTKKEVFSLVFKETNFLNDITIKDKNTLFVSASDTNKIFEVDISNKTYKKLLDFTVPNGLFYEKGILYVAQLGSSSKSMFDAKGKLFKVELDSKKVIQLSKFKGILDGVFKVGQKLYISDWVDMQKSGIIRVYDLKTKKESILNLESFMGAADFWIDENKVYLPQMIGGKISIIDLN